MAGEAFTAADRKSLAVVDRHAKQRDSLVVALLKALLGLWGSFDGWDDRDLVTGHAARSAVLVETALTRSRRLARSYATVMLREADALPERELPPVQDVYPRSGVSASEVYTRPAEQYLWERSIGRTDQEARTHVLERVEKLARMDEQLVTRDETRATYAKAPKVIGWRRVIHPELSESGYSCGLCIVASDRLYSTGELMAVHDGCNCDTCPVTKGFDPGLRLNRDDLDALYEAAGDSTFADDLRETRIRLDEHGELGPILRNAKHSFRDRDDASTSRHTYGPYKPVTEDEHRAGLRAAVERSQRAVIRLQSAIDNGEDSIRLGPSGRERKVSDFTSALSYHNDLISRYLARL